MQMPDSQSGGSSIAADFAQEVNEDIRWTLDNMLINLVSRALGREISTDVDEDVVNQYRTILQNHLDGIGADLEQAFGGGESQVPTEDSGMQIYSSEPSGGMGSGGM